MWAKWLAWPGMKQLQLNKATTLPHGVASILAHTKLPKQEQKRESEKALGQY